VAIPAILAAFLQQAGSKVLSNVGKPPDPWGVEFPDQPKQRYLGLDHFVSPMYTPSERRPLADDPILRAFMG
jgi:hypothetical protein